VFVLDDGMETDMDLGTYERMLDQDLTGDNFVTSGPDLSVPCWTRNATAATSAATCR
jgi:hypothetical protein